MCDINDENTKIKIVLIDDDDDIRFAMSKSLGLYGFKVIGFSSGLEFIERWKNVKFRDSFDILLLDLSLPVLSGKEVLEIIKNDSYNKIIRIIIFSGNSEWTSKTNLLDFGANDYVDKTVKTEELVARIGVQLREVNLLKPKIIKVDNNYIMLLLNSDKRTVSIGDNEKRLTNSEYLLFECFMNNENIILSRTKLEDKILDYKVDLFYIRTRTVDVHIARLRKKLYSLDENLNHCIKNRRGIGWVLDLPKCYKGKCV